MYIKEYWGNYIGGTDDSLSLIAYLGDKKKKDIPLSVLDGATSALAYGDMTPPENEIKNIIVLLDSRKEEELSIRGLMDTREYLLSCLSKCKNQTATDYINRFIDSDNQTLRECAKHAHTGKKSRYE